MYNSSAINNPLLTPRASSQNKIELEQPTSNVEHNFKSTFNQTQAEGKAHVTKKTDKNTLESQKNNEETDRTENIKSTKQQHKNEKFQKSDDLNENSADEQNQPIKKASAEFDKVNVIVEKEKKDDDIPQEQNINDSSLISSSVGSSTNNLPPVFDYNIGIGILSETNEGEKGDAENSVASDIFNVKDGNAFGTALDVQAITSSLNEPLGVEPLNPINTELDQSATIETIVPSMETSLAMQLSPSVEDVDPSLLNEGEYSITNDAVRNSAIKSTGMSTLSNSNLSLETVHNPTIKSAEISILSNSELSLEESVLTAEIQNDDVARSFITSDDTPDFIASDESIEVDTTPKDPKVLFEKMLQSVAGVNSNLSSNSTDTLQNQIVTAQNSAASTSNNSSLISQGMPSFDANLPSSRNFMVQTSIPVTVGQPQWSQSVGEKVLWLAAQNVSSAEIRLDPPDLGTMHVKISVNQDQATVSFTSQHAVVREVLDQNMNRLRDMFTEQGINLVNVDVSDKSFSRQQGEGKGQNSGSKLNEPLVEDETPVAMTMLVQKRLVDHYA